MKASAWTLITPPAEEPLSLDEAKAHLRVVAGDDEDVLIEGYIAAARAWAESYTGRALVTQTWQAHFAGWPCDGLLELPMPPLQSVTMVKYTDSTGVVRTMNSAFYRVVTAYEPGCILLAPDGTWPSETLDEGLPVAVEYVCGYGAAPTSIPAGIKQGMRWMVGHMYENREAVVMGNTMPQKVPFSAHWALDPHRFRYVW